LIFLNCSTAAIIETKQILELFEQATGLSINYHKTTLLPIAIPPETTQELAITFGTTVSSFPQTYLGLPLSPPTKFLLLIISLLFHLATNTSLVGVPPS
jgi:hypothetical protein